MKSKTEIQDGLSMFHGDIVFTKFHPLLFPKCVATKGVVWLAENAECYWLIDAVASHLMVLPPEAQQGMVVWSLRVKPDNVNRGALLLRDDGDGDVVTVQEFESTTFPLDEITIWTMGSGDEAGENVTLLLPGEY